MYNDDSAGPNYEVLSVISNKFQAKAHPFILDALKDENELVIVSNLAHLRHSTIPDEKQIELITPFLKHPEKSVREFAEQSVGLLKKK